MNELRYEQLSKEFEQGLKRPLSEKEQDFLKWLVEKEEAEAQNT